MLLRLTHDSTQINAKGLTLKTGRRRGNEFDPLASDSKLRLNAECSKSREKDQSQPVSRLFVHFNNSTKQWQTGKVFPFEQVSMQVLKSLRSEF